MLTQLGQHPLAVLLRNASPEVPGGQGNSPPAQAAGEQIRGARHASHPSRRHRRDGPDPRGDRRRACDRTASDRRHRLCASPSGDGRGHPSSTIEAVSAAVRALGRRSWAPEVAEAARACACASACAPARGRGPAAAPQVAAWEQARERRPSARTPEWEAATTRTRGGAPHAWRAAWRGRVREPRRVRALWQVRAPLSERRERRVPAWSWRRVEHEPVALTRHGPARSRGR